MLAVRLARASASLRPRAPAPRRALCTNAPEAFRNEKDPRLVAAADARMRDVRLFGAVIVLGWPLEYYLTR